MHFIMVVRLDGNTEYGALASYMYIVEHPYLQNVERSIFVASLISFHMTLTLIQKAGWMVNVNGRPLDEDRTREVSIG